MRTGEVLDLAWTRVSRSADQPPLMVSYEEFREVLRQASDEDRVRHFNICEDKGPCRLSGKKLSKGVWKRVKRKTHVSSNLQRSVKDANEVTVISLYSAWRRTAAKDLEKTLGLQAGTSAGIDMPPLAFHPRHVDTVQRVLSAADVRDGYSLIHWRGERARMDYLKCAKYIVKTKQSIAKKIAAEDARGDGPTPSFILMSSINEDPDLMWGEAEKLMTKRANNTAAEALRALERQGLVKFDALLRAAGVPLRDPGLLAVYDLILAASARYFSTCAYKAAMGHRGKCSHAAQRACRACNHLGKFAGLALAMRKDLPTYSKESTYGCWPQK